MHKPLAAAAGLLVTMAPVGAAWAQGVSFQHGAAYVGSIAGTNAYAMAAPSPRHPANQAFDIACGPVANASTGTGTLAVGGAPGLPINKQTQAGVVPLSAGDIPGNNAQICFQSNASASAWVTTTTLLGGASLNPAGHTVTAAEWEAGQLFIFNTSGITLTLPSATTLGTGGGVTVLTIGNTVTLSPQSGDAIDNGQVGGGGTGASLTIPADITTVVTTSGNTGNTAFSVPLGPVQYFPLSWYAGQNLTSPVSFGRVATPRTVVGVRCRVDTPTGSSGTSIDLYAMPDGVAPGGGTYKLNTTPCNTNGTANTEQNMGINTAYAQIPAGYWIVALPGGTWSNSAGIGAVQVSYR
jgi:hypothetical protein